VTRRETLLAFVDLPYLQTEGDVFCQDAFWLFLERIVAGFERAVVAGRVQADPAEAPCYACRVGERIAFCALPSFSSLYAFREVVRALPELVRRTWAPVGRCDVVLLGIPHPWSLVLWGLARLRGKRVAFLVRQDSQRQVALRAPRRAHGPTLWATRALEAVFVRLARATPTFAVGAEMAGRYRSPSIFVSTVRASEVLDRVTRPIHSGVVRLLWVGRVDREKSPELALAAFRILWQARGGAAALDVVGRGPLLAALRAQAQGLGLADAVRFHGYVPQGPALRKLYESADLLLHSSSSEGFPQVFLEAMAAGLPIATTAAGGIPSALADGVHALLVPCGDAPALAAAAERILADPALASRLANAGLDFARAHTLERETERLLELWP
jgi:glycosyltransferase involved in cell wall biosynthesis